MVFCTVYALILPAITMERPAECGLEEHTHTEACYEKTLCCTLDQDPSRTLTCGMEEGEAHTHTDACYEPGSAHVHTEACYTLTLTCGKQEHIHTAACYPEGEKPDYTCGLEAHTHEPRCYDGAGKLTCAVPEHTHDESCLLPVLTDGISLRADTTEDLKPGAVYALLGWEENGDAYLIRPSGKTVEKEVVLAVLGRDRGGKPCAVLTPRSGGAVTEAALWTLRSEDVPDGSPADMIPASGNGVTLTAEPDEAGRWSLRSLEEPLELLETREPEGEPAFDYAIFAVTLPETDGQTQAPPENAYVCGLEAHTHLEDCFAADGTLTCPLPEHSHTAACLPQAERQYACGLPEHTHTESCRDAAGYVTCGLDEHTHSDGCLLPVLTGTVYRPVESPEDLEPGGAYAVLSVSRSDGACLIGADGESQPVVMTRGVDEAGRACAELSIGRFPAESLSAEVLWTPDGTGDTVLRSVAQPEESLALAAGGEGLWTVDAEDGTSGGVLTAGEQEILLLSAGVMPVNEGNIAICPGAPEDCPEHQALVWTPCDQLNPMGGAHDYNLFLLGDLNNFGVTHGNAAIGGNITGTSKGITYDDGSNNDYSANVTAKNNIGLMLGGSAAGVTGSDGSSGKVPVKNGSYISYDITNIDLDWGDADHYHQVDKGTMDSFFAAAAADLKNSNSAVFTYAKGLADTAGLQDHEGVVRFLTEQDGHDNLTMQGKAGVDLVLEGTDSFYNVFNIPAEQLSANGTLPRNIYLNVPFGSYTTINIIADADSAPSTIESFAPLLWYHDSNGKFISQPADKSQNDDYTQIQRTFINFDPVIRNIVCDVKGAYLYSSVLAPNAKLTVKSGMAISLQGNIVLDSIDCENKNNESATIVNEYQIPGDAVLTKKVVCDACTESTPGGCEILQRNGGAGWEGYFADLVLEFVGQEDTASIRRFYVEGLRLDGTEWQTGALVPGDYRIAEETVYTLSAGGEKIPADIGEHLFSHADFEGGVQTLHIESGQRVTPVAVNHYLKGDYTTYAARKIWKDQEDNLLPAPDGAEIQVQLYCRVAQTGEETPCGEPVTLSGNNYWYYLWTSLPKTDAEGRKLEYFVTEAGGTVGFEEAPGYEDPKTGVWVMVNRKTDIPDGALIVQKVWRDAEGGRIPDADAMKNPAYTASLTLYRVEGRLPAELPKDYTVTLNFPNGTLTRQVTAGSDLRFSADYWVNWYYNTEPTLTWDASAAAQAGAVLNLAGRVGSDYYLDSSGTYTAQRLDGQLRNIQSDVTLTLSASGSYQYLTGTLTPTGSSEVVQALSWTCEEAVSEEWIQWDSLGAEYRDRADYLVTLPLADESLSNSARWQYSWEGLPEKGTDPDGGVVYYRYYVAELPCSGFETIYKYEGQDYAKPETIPVSGGGVITVVNQEKPRYELPDTGGIGTVLYYGTGLLTAGSAAFGLLRRRKSRGKEDKTP